MTTPPPNPLARLVEAAEQAESLLATNGALEGVSHATDQAYMVLFHALAALPQGEPSKADVERMAEWLWEDYDRAWCIASFDHSNGTPWKVLHENKRIAFRSLARTVLKWASGKKEDQ